MSDSFERSNARVSITGSDWLPYGLWRLVGNNVAIPLLTDETVRGDSTCALLSTSPGARIIRQLGSVARMTMSS